MVIEAEDSGPVPVDQRGTDAVGQDEVEEEHRAEAEQPPVAAQSSKPSSTASLILHRLKCIFRCCRRVEDVQQQQVRELHQQSQ